jgi:hypothetical protein
LGKIKAKLDDWKEYELTDREFNLLLIANLALQYNTLKDKIISGILYTICQARFGYSDKINLIFEVDLDLKETDRKTVKVKELSTEDIQAELDKK